MVCILFFPFFRFIDPALHVELSQSVIDVGTDPESRAGGQYGKEPGRNISEYQSAGIATHHIDCIRADTRRTPQPFVEQVGPQQDGLRGRRYLLFDPALHFVPRPEREGFPVEYAQRHEPVGQRPHELIECGHVVEFVLKAVAARVRGPYQAYGSFETQLHLRKSGLGEIGRWRIGRCFGDVDKGHRHRLMAEAPGKHLAERLDIERFVRRMAADQHQCKGVDPVRLEFKAGAFNGQVGAVEEESLGESALQSVEEEMAVGEGQRVDELPQGGTVFIRYAVGRIEEVVAQHGTDPVAHCRALPGKETHGEAARREALRQVFHGRFNHLVGHFISIPVCHSRRWSWLQFLHPAKSS